MSIKIIAWAVLVLSGSYVGYKLGFAIAIAVLLNFSAFYLIMWIDDRDKGRF